MCVTSPKINFLERQKVDVCDFAYSCVWRIHMCGMTRPCVWYGAFMCVAYLKMNSSWETESRRVWHCWFMCVAYSCVWLDWVICVIWSISCVWHGSFMCVAWLSYVCVMCVPMAHTHNCNTLRRSVILCNALSVSYTAAALTWKDTATHCNTLQHTQLCVCAMGHSYVWRDSFICVTWLIRRCDVTHSYVWRDSFLCVTWLICVSGTTRPHAWQDSFTCVTHLAFVTWLINMRDITHPHLWRN